jgi:hypothetical protein
MGAFPSILRNSPVYLIVSAETQERRAEMRVEVGSVKLGLKTSTFCLIPENEFEESYIRALYDLKARFHGTSRLITADVEFLDEGANLNVRFEIVSPTQ